MWIPGEKQLISLGYTSSPPSACRGTPPKAWHDTRRGENFFFKKYKIHSCLPMDCVSRRSPLIKLTVSLLPTTLKSTVFLGEPCVKTWIRLRETTFKTISITSSNLQITVTVRYTTKNIFIRWIRSKPHRFDHTRLWFIHLIRVGRCMCLYESAFGFQWFLRSKMLKACCNGFVTVIKTCLFVKSDQTLSVLTLMWSNPLINYYWTSCVHQIWLSYGTWTEREVSPLLS